MPPRHTKLVCVLTFLVMGKFPNKIMQTTHTDEHGRFGRKVRNMMDSNDTKCFLM